MNRRVWMGGVFLSLCGWACAAHAQEVTWRPSAHPAELLPPTRLEVLPNIGATLGRPVPMRPGTPWIDPGVVTASYQEPPAPTPVPRNLPDVVGSSEPDEPSAFAADRTVRPAVFPGEPIAVTPRPGPAVDQDAQPFAPAPEMDAPMDDGTFGLFPALASWTPRFYARGEYLLMSFKKDSVPPLVTTSAPADNGILGRQTTRVLFGGDGLGSGTHSGGRFVAGFWLDDCETKAIEFGGFFLPGDTRRFDANSAFFPVLARPFFSVNRNAEFAQLTAFPGVSTGNISVQNSSNLWGLESNLRCCLCSGCTECDDMCCGGGLNYHVAGLAGFRYLNLNEDLRISESLVNSAAAATPNVAATVFDDFATRNQFYGGQVGLDAEFGRGSWSLDLTGKLALGDTSQQININGGQQVRNLATGVTQNFKGGLLALSSNIGSHNRNEFSVVPEVNATLSYHLNEHWRLFAGYDVLYWTNVVRPGEQIDRVLNEQLIPNFLSNPPASSALRPAVPFRESDFWAQGLNLGLEFRY